MYKGNIKSSITLLFMWAAQKNAYLDELESHFEENLKRDVLNTKM